MIANIIIAWRTPNSSSVVRAIISTVMSPAMNAPSAKNRTAPPTNSVVAVVAHQASPDAELLGLAPPEPALVPDDMKLYALAPIAFDRSTMAAHK